MNIRILLVLILFVAFLGETLGATIIKIYDPVTGIETNRGVVVNFSVKSTPKIVKHGEKVFPFPKSLPFGDTKLREYLATNTTHFGLTTYQENDSPEGSVTFAEYSPSNKVFTNYSEFLSFSRKVVREISEFTLKVISTNAEYNPQKPIMVWLSAVYFNESEEFEYWNNFFQSKALTPEMVDGMMSLPKDFVSSWIPQVANSPFFKFGIESVSRSILLYKESWSAQYILQHDTLSNESRNEDVWREYDGLHIRHTFTLRPEGAKVDWIILVHMESGRRFVVRSDGQIVESDPRITLIPYDEIFEVSVVNGEPGSKLDIETKINLHDSWSPFATITFDHTGKVRAGNSINTGQRFFRIKP